MSEYDVIIQQIQSDKFSLTELLFMRQAIDQSCARYGGAELNDIERKLVRNNEIIPAIKALRNRTGLTLVASKNIVDVYRNSL